MPSTVYQGPKTEGRTITFAQGIREALSESLARDPTVFLMGEGIADPAAFFGTTAGILERFGASRMVEMPVAENGLVGVAIGAAMNGRRPVISFHRVEFALLAFEQIANNAAKMHYVSNGHHRVPLVIRLIIGRGWGQGPEHSQCLEPIFAHIPGLKVVMPTFAGDAKGLLIAAIEDDNPVIFLEHRWLHNVVGYVPDGYVREELSGPRVVVPGTDATIVATSYMTLEALRAAEALKTVGFMAEVIDLRVLRPLNADPIVASVKRTGGLVHVDSGWTTYGIGAEVVARVVAGAFGDLKSAPIRLGLPDHPTPSSRGLVQGFYPDAAKIVDAVAKVAKLPSETVARVQGLLNKERANLSIDTPDPFFKGPF